MSWGKGGEAVWAKGLRGAGVHRNTVIFFSLHSQDGFLLRSRRKNDAVQTVCVQYQKEKENNKSSYAMCVLIVVLILGCLLTNTFSKKKKKKKILTSRGADCGPGFRGEGQTWTAVWLGVWALSAKGKKKICLKKYVQREG